MFIDCESSSTEYKNSNKNSSHLMQFLVRIQSCPVFINQASNFLCMSAMFQHLQDFCPLFSFPAAASFLYVCFLLYLCVTLSILMSPPGAIPSKSHSVSSIFFFWGCDLCVLIRTNRARLWHCSSNPRGLLFSKMSCALCLRAFLFPAAPVHVL